MRKKLGIYIHIPFCLRKCHYCDFLSFAGADSSVHTHYVGQIAKEIAGRGARLWDAYEVDSIFLGGGTPSLLPPKLINAILEAVYARFRIVDSVETTLESNPGTLSAKHLRGYRDAGINRLSLGVQSFDDAKLSRLGRVHGAETALRSYRHIRDAGFDNVNLDLIFGVPEETMEIWEQDIETALSLEPEHLSFYSLQVEEGTRIFGALASGDLEALSEIEDRRMYHLAMQALSEAGYHHYEISNAAKPGFESRHNLKYWSMDDYLGFGLGAHSYVSGQRFANTEIWKDYMGAASWDGMTDWVHINTVKDEISEFVFLGLRKTEGIDLRLFEQRFGKSFNELFQSETDGLIARGLLVQQADRLRLTPLGLDLSNKVFAEYV